MCMREIKYLLLCPVSFHNKTKYSICGKLLGVFSFRSVRFPFRSEDKYEANLRIAVLQYMQNYFSETGIT